jgi:hypothetical protein
MKLKQKKILAKEILVFAVIIIVSSIIYFAFNLYDQNIRKCNTEISIKIRNISSEIEIKADSLNNLRSPLNLTEALKILKPWEKFDEDGKPRFNPNKEYEIYDEYGIKKKINPKKDSLMSVSLKNQLLKLAEQRKILESQIVSKIDLKGRIKESIMILFILAYPLRFLIIGIIWSMKILKRKEN